MPDFFDRLVARGGLREPAGVARVRPRLPSLFERPQPPAEPTPYQKTPRPRPTASAANPPGARSGPLGERRAEPALVQLVRQPVVYRNEQRVVAAPGPTPVPPGPVRPPAVLRPTAPRPTGPPRPAQRITPPAAAPEPRARPKTAPAAARPAAARAGGRTRRPARPPAREPAPARRRQQPPRPERVVHVSIGRLEVRAAAPGPAPRPRPGRPAPVVPLDEFLAREEG
ncbi:hypothetical protein LI90_3131 [Carbonactinospora thermoautotrophica]|uniref:Uncharacterized protein n=1 Tax=Carbonactinospora thermoautotrophica TaxID=1469144 RepID=A0A132MXK4_9ACTN|nr:hypothetical protein [Carbonactinospora thermoautotrophica]KWX02092.1 hypothetical protein LI90_3131 [Carbonactinospora thermoautotrophica]